MKPIQIALAPTRNRPLNMFLGVVLALVSVLFFCALATYHTSDPSWNTAADPAAPGTIANWVGPFGAFLSDLLLQWIGFTAFLLPLWMGGIAWGWMRSRPGGSSVLRAVGMVMAARVSARAVRHAALALALGARGSGRRRNGAPGLRAAGPVPQYPGSMDRGRRPGRRRALLCVRPQLLGGEGDGGGPLDLVAVLVRAVAELADGPRRPAGRRRGIRGGAEQSRTGAAAVCRRHRGGRGSGAGGAEAPSRLAALFGRKNRAPEAGPGGSARHPARGGFESGRRAHPHHAAHQHLGTDAGDRGARAKSGCRPGATCRPGLIRRG